MKTVLLAVLLALSGCASGDGPGDVPPPDAGTAGAAGTSAAGASGWNTGGTRGSAGTGGVGGASADASISGAAGAGLPICEEDWPPCEAGVHTYNDSPGSASPTCGAARACAECFFADPSRGFASRCIVYGNVYCGVPRGKLGVVDCGCAASKVVTDDRGITSVVSYDCSTGAPPPQF